MVAIKQEELYSRHYLNHKSFLIKTNVRWAYAFDQGIDI